MFGNPALHLRQEKLKSIESEPQGCVEIDPVNARQVAIVGIYLLLPHEGNIDHVLLRSRGGKTSWDNCKRPAKPLDRRIIDLTKNVEMSDMM